MDIIKLIMSIICFVMALFLGLLSSITQKTYKIKDRINDIPRYMKRGFVNKYYGKHESKYTVLDDAQFHYSLDRMNDTIIVGGVEKKIKTKSLGIDHEIINKKKESINNKEILTHSWYNFKTWQHLYESINYWHNYLNDRKRARYEFLFNWDKVFEKVMPLVKDQKHESIGIIRAESDNKTLYVHSVETSSTIESTASYAAGVPYKLVKKYANIPGYFLFHTHPMRIDIDPFPSDTDLYTCLLDCYSNRFVGHVVIGKYGAIVYFLKDERMSQLESGGALKFFTYCYDLINAWNSFCNSSALINQKDRLSFLEKWGFDMIIIPSSYYISDSYDKLFLPGVLHDKFINTKYELMEKIKDFIKKLEIEDEKKIKNKKK